MKEYQGQLELRQSASKKIKILQQEGDEIPDINSMSMISPVQMIDGQFETRLGFRTFDWLLSEQIINLEISQEKLEEDIDEVQKLRLLLNIYPNQSTFLHTVA